MKRLLFVLLATGLFAMAPIPALAQNATTDEGVLVRVGGDASLAADEEAGVVVVVNGNLSMRGNASTVVVVDGAVDIRDAELDRLVVVRGTVTLGPGTLVNGDIFLTDVDLTRDPGAVITGSINDGVDWELVRGFWIVGLIFLLGLGVLAILAALALAAFAAEPVRRAGRALTSEPGQTVVAALVLWIVVPILAVLLFATLVGIPSALAIWFFVLPLAGFFGLLVVGIRLGEYFVARDGGVGHPYLAAFLGVLTLIVAGAIPIIGPIVIALAGFVGGGAIALTAWRAMRGAPPEAVPSSDELLTPA